MIKSLFKEIQKFFSYIIQRENIQIMQYRSEYTGNKQKVLEAKYNLREQANYLAELQKKKLRHPVNLDKQNQEMQKLLTHSIKKAKEKLYSIDNSIQQKNSQLNSQYRDVMSKQSQNYNTQNFTSINTVQSKQMKNLSQCTDMKKKPWIQSNSNAVASAMKCLQTKITDLQSKVELLQKEKKNLLKEKDRANSQLKKCNHQFEIYKKQYQTQKQTNEQIISEKKNLQHSIEIMRKTLQEKDKKYQKLKLEKVRDDKRSMNRQELNNMLKEIDESRTINNNKAEQNQQKQQQLKEFELELKSKQKQLQKKFQQIGKVQKEVIKKQKQIKKIQESMSTQNNIKQKQLLMKIKQLETKNQELQKENSYNKIYMKKVQSEFEITKQKLEMVTQKSSKELPQQLQEAYNIKINSLEQEIHRLKTKNKKSSFQEKLDLLKQQNEKLKDMYQSILQRYERTQQKRQNQQKQSKAYRTKFWQLKEIQKELAQKLLKLPNATTSQIKYLLTKAGKIEHQTYKNEHTSRSSDKLTTSGRLKSQSKEKSNKKKKTLRMEDLNSSKNSAKSISVTRSRVLNEMRQSKKQYSEKSAKKSKSSMKKISMSNQKIKDQMIKQQNHFKILTFTDRQLGIQTQITEIQNKNIAMKKQYKMLVNKQNTEKLSNSEQEQIRDRVNFLGMQILMNEQKLSDLKSKEKQFV